MTDELKTGFDVAAVAGGIGSWFAIIPDVAAILSIIWQVYLQFYGLASALGNLRRSKN